MDKRSQRGNRDRGLRVQSSGSGGCGGAGDEPERFTLRRSILRLLPASQSKPTMLMTAEPALPLIPAEELARIRALLEEGLHFRAFELAREFGELGQ